MSFKSDLKTTIFSHKKDKRRIDIFAKNSGFVFNQIHNIFADVPPENAIAILKSACEYGKY